MPFTFYVPVDLIFYLIAFCVCELLYLVYDLHRLIIIIIIIIIVLAV